MLPLIRLLVPAALHRAALRIAHGLRKRFWRWRGSRTRVEGCRIVALDPQGRVLLVRHSYGSGRWVTPGGGLHSGEDGRQAARRELHEETGCALRDAALVEIIEETLHGASHRIHVVAGRTDCDPRADLREVMEARFFDPAALPPGMAAGIAQSIAAAVDEYRRQSSAS